MDEDQASLADRATAESHALGGPSWNQVPPPPPPLPPTFSLSCPLAQAQERAVQAWGGGGRGGAHSDIGNCSPPFPAHAGTPPPWAMLLRIHAFSRDDECRAVDTKTSSAPLRVLLHRNHGSSLYRGRNSCVNHRNPPYPTHPGTLAVAANLIPTDASLCTRIARVGMGLRSCAGVGARGCLPACVWQRKLAPGRCGQYDSTPLKVGDPTKSRRP